MTIQPTTFAACSHLCSLAFVLQQVEQLYASALEAFPSSARLHWFVSQFVRYYKVNRHVEQLHLVAAEVRGLLPFFNLMQTMQHFFIKGVRLLTGALRWLEYYAARSCRGERIGGRIYHCFLYTICSTHLIWVGICNTR